MGETWTGFSPMSNALLADDAVAAPRAGTRPRLWRRKLAAAGVVLGVVAAVWVGLEWFTTGRFIESTDDAYVGGDVTDIAPQVSGVIARVAVADNQLVHAGDLLVQIDDRDFVAALNKAKAATAADEASLANLQAMKTLQLSLIGEASAQTVSAAAQVKLARSNQARYAHLAATQAGTEQDAETGNANFTEAQAALVKAAAAADAAREQLAVIATQVQQTQAALAGAVAAQQAAALQLGYTQIRAPFDGVVGNRSAHVGGYASAGAQLISIVPATGLWVDANFKEDQLARIAVGQSVNIVADILPGEKITGHVASIAPASGDVFSILPAENATGNFTKIVQRVSVRIALDGAAGDIGLLRPGLSVTAEVNTK
jgi:membrane fusion protein (multidrug efflux system)